MLNYPVGPLGKEIGKGWSGQSIIKALDYNRVANVVRNRINADIERCPDNTQTFVAIEKIAREISEDIETIKSVARLYGETDEGFWVSKGQTVSDAA